MTRLINLLNLARALHSRDLSKLLQVGDHGLVSAAVRNSPRMHHARRGGVVRVPRPLVLRL